MRKTVCDVCGKEIITINPYEFRLGRKINIRGGLGNDTLNEHSIICQDVCNECANSIYHYIKSLQEDSIYHYSAGLQAGLQKENNK